MTLEPHGAFTLEVHTTAELAMAGPVTRLADELIARILSALPVSALTQAEATCRRWCVDGRCTPPFSTLPATSLAPVQVEAGDRT